MFLVENGLKQGGAISPFVFSFASKLCTIRLSGWLVGGWLVTVAFCY
jgi:hypothetical protein